MALWALRGRGLPEAPGRNGPPGGPRVHGVSGGSVPPARPGGDLAAARVRDPCADHRHLAVSPLVGVRSLTAGGPRAARWSVIRVPGAGARISPPPRLARTPSSGTRQPPR